MSNRKQITLPHQKDSMGSLINPTNGYRGELVKRGIAPKNHIRENLKELRLTQTKLKQEKEEKEMAEIYSKDLFKLPQFQNVSSRINNRADLVESEDFGNAKFLTRGQSEMRREELARESKLVRRELESKFAEEGSIDRKAPVPKATEINTLPEARNANFIQRNKVSAITMHSKKNYFEKDEEDLKHDEYGKIPQYLEDRKAQWKAEEEERRRRLPDPDCPPGMCVMPESERLETLQVLQDSKEEALVQLRKLPFVIETPSMRKKQEFLDNKLREIDHALAIFSKPKVYVAIDR